jgi:Ca2+ transporting ATPase
MDMIIENFEDPTLRILCAAAIASLILGVMTHGIKEGWLEGVSILLAVVIIVAVTSFNNYMKEQQFRKLNEMAAKKNVNVIRNNRVDNINVEDLLVGDIVQIETGEIMSVDGVVFSANRLGMDESSITG